ncbi:MAG: methionyl-tRNA formyltransferase [Candidatus Saccharimonas sp.]|nr:methionyl-tRNA formyltransferase [Candidatus Saccharimonas sp.]
MGSGTSQPIVFFGTEEYSLWVLQALVEAGYPIVAVVTKPDTKKGRGLRVSEPAIKTYARDHGIAVWQPAKLTDAIDDIKALNNPAAVLVAFGRIIPQSILDLFTPGIINVHPSLLPLYRGPSPVEAAISNRDAKTGVSIMQLTKEMDAGPVYIQIPYVLDQSETKPELYRTLFTLGANILVKELPAILERQIPALPQDERQATYCQLLSKADSILQLTTTTPGDAEARIRAHIGFPRTRLRIGQHDVIVTKAHAVLDKQTPLDLECSNGAFLSIDELVAPSGKTMNAAEFLRGYTT